MCVCPFFPIFFLIYIREGDIAIRSSKKKKKKKKRATVDRPKTILLLLDWTMKKETNNVLDGSLINFLSSSSSS